MPRLTKEQWEQIRADYEVHGLGNRELSRKYGLSTSTLSERAKKEQWVQGKTEQLVSRKIAAVKEMREIELETEQFGRVERRAFEKEVKDRLDLEGIRTSYYAELYAKGRELLKKVETPEQWKTLASGAKDLAPREGVGTVVNVASTPIMRPLTPKEAMESIIQQMEAEREDSQEQLLR
ncbi:MAG: hypothetical protein IKN64_11270 [Desulfovibrio sp.]|nr:hypothetical protein [Desulfovibrio sp.]